MNNPIDMVANTQEEVDKVVTSYVSYDAYNPRRVYTEFPVLIEVDIDRGYSWAYSFKEIEELYLHMKQLKEGE
jgi:hypothetical protein